MTGRADPWLRRFLSACRTGPSAVVGMAALLVVCAMALYSVFLDGRDPFDIVSLPHRAPTFVGPLPLGTDYLGRDLAVCLLAGAAPTLSVAAVAAGLAMVLGVALGALAGFFGGRLDDLLMRFTEFFQVLPALLFAMVLVTLWSPSPTTIALTIGFVAWPPTARLARAEFLRIRDLEYVVAARAAGAGAGHLMWRVILPNAAPPLIVSATLVVTTAIL
ncbi:MAG TPA: ABC transporter permease, partial [Hyphomicrobiales bacterium]|nr:ABC transporter permease [Hyphomicrobiales bacterium]